MRILFAVSYALLSGLVIIEAVILREALQAVLRFNRFYSVSTQGIEQHVRLPRGALAPEFSGPLLGMGKKILTIGELKGHSTILLFVSPGDTSSAGHKHLTPALHALWHRLEGYIYLICRGTEEACRQHGPDRQIHELGDPALMVLDEGGHIARRFHIEATPMAVELDEDLRIARYGWPVTADPAATRTALRLNLTGEANQDTELVSLPRGGSIAGSNEISYAAIQ
jgi:hypothetical protein